MLSASASIQPSALRATVTLALILGGNPSGIAFDPDNGYMYVANQFFNTTTVIDTKTNTIVKNIPVGRAPIGVAYDPANKDIYVANAASNTTSVIDPATNTVIDTIPVGLCPVRPTFDPVNNDMYVVNRFSAGPSMPSSISVIDSRTNKVTATIVLGPQVTPETAAFDPVNNDLYVTATSFGSGIHPPPLQGVVFVISSANSILTTIPVPELFPLDISFNPRNNDLYVTGNILSNNVTIIDSSTNSIITTVSTSTSLGAGALFAAYEPAIRHGVMLVTNPGAFTVTAISSRNFGVIGAITIIGAAIAPAGLALNPVNNDMYVTDLYGRVLVITP